MRRTFLKSKIHNAVVTEADLEYEGSLTLDRDLMDAADLLPFERVEIYNITNGNRLATYLLEGEAGSGTVCPNGAAAHLCRKGDRIIIASYADLEPSEVEDFRARIVLAGEKNRVRSRKLVEVGRLLAKSTT
jgi:aspartate 1-decarboxylase